MTAYELTALRREESQTWLSFGKKLGQPLKRWLGTSQEVDKRRLRLRTELLKSVLLLSKTLALLQLIPSLQLPRFQQVPVLVALFGILGGKSPFPLTTIEAMRRPLPSAGLPWRLAKTITPVSSFPA